MNKNMLLIEQAKLFSKEDPLYFLLWALKMKKADVTWIYDIAIENNLIINKEEA